MEHSKNFGAAIEHLKSGGKIQRAGWHGKGMSVKILALEGMRACMALELPDGSIQPGWNASTADVLAEDWALID